MYKFIFNFNIFKHFSMKIFAHKWSIQLWNRIQLGHKLSCKTCVYWKRLYCGILLPMASANKKSNNISTQAKCIKKQKYLTLIRTRTNVISMFVSLKSNTSAGMVPLELFFHSNWTRKSPSWRRPNSWTFLFSFDRIWTSLSFGDAQRNAIVDVFFLWPI